MKNIKKIIPLSLFILLLSATCLLAGCAFSDKFRVKFYVGDELYYVVKTKGNEKIKAPDDPQVDGYNFEGWYFDYTLKEKVSLDYVLRDNILVFAKFVEIS